MLKNNSIFSHLKDRVVWVRNQTLKIHGLAHDTRIASSLSAVEIFTVLYYGKIIRFNPNNTSWNGRDRFIISKGHGAISFYPILADLGYFDKKELERVCKSGSFLGGIPDCIIPGFETINGSLGHGLGVACGISLALKIKKIKRNVFVLLGDGELDEGSVWEAIMFAGHHRLDNLNLIIDNNKISMLGYCKNILDLEPFEDKFKAYQWVVVRADGHDVKQLYDKFKMMSGTLIGKPKVLIADTVKGRGVSMLENDPLCHIRNLSREDIAKMIGDNSD